LAPLRAYMSMSVSRESRNLRKSTRLNSHVTYMLNIGHEGSFVGTILRTLRRRFRAASGHSIRDDKCCFIGRSIS
jgi:hypothetical protein